MQKTKSVETTLGELTVALTDAAMELLPDARDAHLVVGLILDEFLSGERHWLRSRRTARRAAYPKGERSCYSARLAS